MDILISVAAIAVAILVGAASPGPSFFVVARSSIAEGRRNGLAVALGMGAGGALFAALALFGLQVFLMHAGWLYLALKVFGGLYLVWLALRIWRGADTPVSPSEEVSSSAAGLARWSFLRGVTAQIANPKTAIIYAGVFAALLPLNPPIWTGAILIPVLFAVEAGWYAVVATVFSSHRPRKAYLRSKKWTDRGAALVIGSLGLRLSTDAIWTE